MPPIFVFRNRLIPSLDEAELGGSNVESIDIGGKAGKGLLGSIGTGDNVSMSGLSETGENGNAYRMRVLILTVSMSYSFLRACLIWALLALTSTMKTRVFCSSIFFRAPSVLRGWTMTLCSSRRGAWGTDLRGYGFDLGSL